jgi:diaminopimelate epimerase
MVDRESADGPALADVSFAKYQALGNDYIVIEEEELPSPSPQLIRRICDRHWGLGGDGILLGGPRSGDRFRLRILNPSPSRSRETTA